MNSSIHCGESSRGRVLLVYRQYHNWILVSTHLNLYFPGKFAKCFHNTLSFPLHQCSF